MASSSGSNNTAVSVEMARDAKSHRLELCNDCGASYRLWRQRWDDYAVLAGLAGKPANIQMAILRTCLSDVALAVVANLDATEARLSAMTSPLSWTTWSVVRSTMSFSAGLSTCVSLLQKAFIKIIAK